MTSNDIALLAGHIYLAAGMVISGLNGNIVSALICICICTGAVIIGCGLMAKRRAE